MSKRFGLLNILIILFFIFAPEALFGQSKNDFSQELKWHSDNNAMEFRVEIKNMADGSNEFFTTSKNSITVNLSAGDYEYRVYAYDFLGRESSVSEWRKFKVLKAMVPSVSVPKNVETNVKKSQIEVPVEISNIEQESKVELINEETNEVVKGSFETIVEEGKTVAASVIFPNIDEGDWKLRVTNPSGLSTESEVINIEDKAKLLAQEKAMEEAAKAEAKAEEKRLALEEKERIKQEKEAAAKAKEEEKKKAEEEKRRIQEEKIEERKRQAEEVRKRQEEAQERARQAAEKQKEENKAMAQRRAEQKALAEERAKEVKKREIKAKEAEKKFQAAQKELEKAREEEEKLLRAEEERIAREKEAEEKQKERSAKLKAYLEAPKKDICIQIGGGAISPITINNYFKLSNTSTYKITPVLKLDFTAYPIALGKIRFGLGASAYGSHIKTIDDSINFISYYGMFNFNLAARFPISKEKLFIGAKAGGGLSSFYINVYYPDFPERQRVSAPLYGAFCVNGELSFIFMPVSIVVCELGANYQHVFIEGMEFNTIAAFLSLGVRF